MRAHTQALLNECATVATPLCREARAHSDHLMSSVLSFGFKDIEECTPTGVHDGFRQVMVLDHVDDLKVFYGNMVILFGILLC